MEAIKAMQSVATEPAAVEDDKKKK